VAEVASTTRPAPARRSRLGRWLRRLGLGLLIFLAACLVFTFCLWLSIPKVSQLARTNPSTTAFIELRRAQAAAAGRPWKLRQSWRSLPHISPYLRYAVVRAEDFNFYRHEGIDWDATLEAIEINWDQRRWAVGGSTITQQVAKNLFLSPSKNPIRKLREWWIASRLEDELSKRRILEIYLNIVELGDGVFGAEAAARYYWGKSAADLSPVEAARLTVALPNPRTRSPALHTADLDRRAARLVRSMHIAKLIDDAATAAALAQLGQH
jgi:monofunctional biosynthetic peptidoglycan transglycosylase